MNPAARHRESFRLTTLIAMVLIVAVLYWAREVLIPVALAILLCFILAPLANRFERIGLRRVPSVLLTTCLAGAIIAVLAWIVSAQVVDLIDQLPSYRQNIREKVRDLRGQTSELLGRATEKLQDIGRDVAEAAAEADVQAAAGSGLPPPEPETPSPVPVVIEEPLPPPVTALLQNLSPVMRPLVSTGIVIVFVIFMLLEREKLRDRFIRVIGQRRLILTTQAIDEASRRISRYLVSLLALNVGYGIIASMGLLVIGVPNALLWGVLAAVLRFIPYVGPWLGALLPIVLSFAAFDGWTKPAMTAGMFIVLELFSNNVAEPLVYGARTGISSLAVLTGVLFWTWLWGPVGLILATPLTVCLVVIGRYVPELEPLSVLLGNEPALPPHVRVYQRLLAGDDDDAFRLAESFLHSSGMKKLQGEVLLPALLMAEHDHHRGAISTDLLQSIRSSMRDLLEEIDAMQPPPDRAQPETAGTAEDDVGAAVGADAASAAATQPSRATVTAPLRVLCLPALSEADELACRMLAHSAASNHAAIDVLSSRMLSTEMVQQAMKGDHEVVLVSALAPMSLAAARKVVGELGRRRADRRLIVGLWGTHDLEHLARRLHLRESAAAISSFDEALRMLDELAGVPRPADAGA